jgi:4-methyl-5(b-hydroxyethyl)-thiazole monophosphate biosynthesis
LDSLFHEVKKKTAILLYPLFSEYELSVAQSILMQGNKPVLTVGINHHPVNGEAGLTCLPDTSVEEIDIREIDSLLLPGCLDISTLIHEEKWFDFIRRVTDEQTIIASISSSPFLLAKAGVLKGKKYTVGLTEEAIDELGVFDKEYYSNDLLVQDGNIITARGSGFIEFGEAFGKMLNLDFNPKWYGK